MSIIRTARGTLLGLLMCTPVMIFSQVKPWEDMGPGGGFMNFLVQNRGNPSLLLTCSAGESFIYPGGRIFKSSDKGETWNYLGCLVDYPSKLVWDPVDPSLVYSWGGVSGHLPSGRSSDGGQTWQSLEHPGALTITGLAMDPSDHTILHASALMEYDPALSRARPAYARGRAGDSSWATTILSTENGWSSAVEIDISHPERIYVAGDANGYPKLWRSTDGGKSFSTLSLPAEMWLSDIVADPSVPGRLFGLTYNRIYLSTNSGDSWVVGSSDTLGPTCITEADGILYVGTANHGAWKSTDGLTYTPLDGSQGRPMGWGSPQSLCVEPTTPHTILFTNASGIVKSTDGGGSWKACNRGLSLGAISSIRYTPGSPGALLAARANYSVFKTLGASATPVVWEQLPDFYACTNVSDIAISPSDPNVILALEGGS